MDKVIIVALIALMMGVANAQQPTFSMQSSDCVDAPQQGGAQWCFDTTNHLIYNFTASGWVVATPAAETYTVLNAASVVNTLTKLVNGKARIAQTTDSGGVIGICVANCGAGGNASIQIDGNASCVFDSNGATAGDYVQISSVTGGDCHDFGATRPSSGQIIGRALFNDAGAGTYPILLYPQEQYGP